MSDKPRSGCSKFVAFILALILIITLPLALLAFNISRVVFNPNLTKRVFTEVLVESNLLPVIMEWYAETRAGERIETGVAVPDENEPHVVQLMAFMDTEDWLSIKKEVLKDEFIGDFVGDGLDGVYAWLDSDETYPQVTFDLRDFKANALGEPGDRAVMTQYEALPPCTDEQVADLVHRIKLAQDAQKSLKACGLADPWTEAADQAFRACTGDNTVLYQICTFPDPWEEQAAEEFVQCARIAEKGEALYNLCQFPDPWTEDQIDDYHDSLVDVVNGAPDDLDVTGQITENEIVLLKNVDPLWLKELLRLIRLLSWVGWLVPLVMLILIFLVGGRTVKGAGYWMGVPLILGSLLAVPFALVYRPLIMAVMVRVPLEAVPDMVITEATNALGYLARAVFLPMLIQIVVILALGVVFIAVAATAKPGAPVSMDVEEEDE